MQSCVIKEKEIEKHVPANVWNDTQGTEKFGCMRKTSFTDFLAFSTTC